MMATVADYQSRRSELPDPETAALDMDLLLCHVLGKPRYFLFAHPEQQLSPRDGEALEQLIKRRCAGEPIAYMTGRAEFWGLTLAVSPATLIPRPDTEVLVEWVLELFPDNTPRSVLDLGTGTGAIALALASERPSWSVRGVDILPEAVALAQANSRALKLGQVCFSQSDWFADLDAQKFDLLVSNPPYIEAGDSHLSGPGVAFEPASALVAGDDGLEAIRRIAAQAPQYLKAGSQLLLEHGYRQAGAVAAILRAAGFCKVETRCDYGGNPRVTRGYFGGGES